MNYVRPVLIILSCTVTHEMRFAKSIASNVVFLAERSVYEQGTAKQIFEHPFRELTRRFVYRSRMFERSVAKDSMDIYALCSEIRSFAVPYGMNQRQFRGMEYLFDELLLPTLRALQKPEASAMIRVIADESGTGYDVTMEFPMAKADLLAAECIDEMGKKIMTAFTKSLISRKNAAGVWAVNAEL